MLDAATHNAAMETLREAGLLADSLIADGKMHRIPTLTKPKSKNGAYKVHPDYPPVLWLENFETGERGSHVLLTEDTPPLSDEERRSIAARARQMKAEREAERAAEQADAAKLAYSLWNAATECMVSGHPYLTTKKVKPVPGLRVGTDGYDNRNALLVPLYDENGVLWSVQSILGTGPQQKLYQREARKEGCFFPIGGNDDSKPLLLCEGLATGLSLHECTTYQVWAACDAGNLLPVAEAARRLNPGRKIIICADYDEPSKKYPDPGGVGLAKAKAAAQAVDAFLAVPQLRSCSKADWNDVHVAQGQDEVWSQLQKASKPEPAQDGALKTQASAKGEKLPAGFSIRTTGSQPGLWHTEIKNDGDPVETWIGPPLHVLASTRDNNSEEWGLLLEWHDEDGIKHTWAMPRALLISRDYAAWLKPIAGGGWKGALSGRSKSKLLDYLSMSSPAQRALCVERTGWHHNAFVFPDATIKASAGQEGTRGADEQIVLQTQTLHNPFRMAGTLEGWQETIGTWTQGNSRLMLAVCASLAAPLLYMAGQESGGFNWVGQSSTGKTTALVAAGSVWGEGSPSGGYIQNWRATANGLEGLAALHSDAVLALDKLGQAPGRTVMEASYMLANGVGKSRAYQDGSARKAKSWRCMVLSTGEKGLADKIAEEGGRIQAGQSVRLIDIPADAGAGLGLFEDLHGHESARAFADAIKLAATTDYGHAAHAFITLYQENRAEADETLHKGLSGLEIICPASADGQVQRVARRFLLCALAGEMAAEWGLLPWEQGEALKAVKVCFDAWLAVRGGTGAAEDTAIVEQVRLFIEQHGSSRFQDIDAPSATCINRVGFRRSTQDRTIYYVLPESFKEVCRGHDSTRAARVLRDAGILVPDGKHLKSKSPVLPGQGRIQCYALRYNAEEAVYENA